MSHKDNLVKQWCTLQTIIDTAREMLHEADRVGTGNRFRWDDTADTLIEALRKQRDVETQLVSLPCL